MYECACECVYVCLCVHTLREMGSIYNSALNLSYLNLVYSVEFVYSSVHLNGHIFAVVFVGIMFTYFLDTCKGIGLGTDRKE